MPEDSAIEQSYQDWKAARAKLDGAREQLGLVAKAVTDAPIETPSKALTPEAAAELGRLEDEVDKTWSAFRKARRGG